MTKNIKNVLKIFILAFFIITIINIYNYLFNANINNSQNQIENVSNENSDESSNNNNSTYKNQKNSKLWITWVAISTNIGTSYSQIKYLPATIYKEIFSVNDLIKDKNNNDELIWNNMIIIKEYLNILKTDIKSLIEASYDKSELLNAYIDQLEYRYQNWIENERLLNTQKEILINTMTNANSQIEIIKTKIEEDFKNSNAEASLENIEQYLDLKTQYNYAKTYIIYINQFIAQYDFLNTYTIDLADLLINNKEAIIKNAYIVTTDKTSISDLADFNLIFEE